MCAKCGTFIIKFICSFEKNIYENEYKDCGYTISKPYTTKYQIHACIWYFVVMSVLF